MDIKQTKRTIKGLPPKHSILIEGDHGIGKSEIIAQTAREMSILTGKTYGFIDIRLGQYEVGDLIGIPRARDTFTITNTVFTNGEAVKQDVLAENVTAHDLPLWFPRDPESHGFMFFDELNRGTRDTQQWAMQIVLDYKSNFNEVPINWRVIAACNDNQDVYSVLGLDPALYDRFLVVKLRPTIPEWLDHAEKIGVHDAIIKYIRKFGSDLDVPEKVESGKKCPSRRSWVKLSNVIRHMAENGDDLFQDSDYLILLAGGYVGTSVAINFVEFIKKEYKVYSAKEILNNFLKIKDNFKGMIATDFTYYTKEVVDYMKKNKITLSKKQGNHLLDFVKTMPKETAAGLWVSLRKEVPDEATRWYTGNKEAETYIRNLLRKG